jgi:nucleoside-diphosphate-sugar epimerase
MSARTVLVTGAAGFMGRALCSRFRADGWNVLGVDRQADPTGQIVSGDLATKGPWQDRFDGVDLVVHTAALVSNTTPRDEAWRVNVCGTRNVVEASAAAGVRRLVHVSSVAVYSHHRPDHVDERWPVRPDGDVYGDTKIAAEQVVWQAHAAGEVTATVVRPGDVYGPGSRPWTIIPVQMLAAGQVVLPANGRGTFNSIYIDDLIDALVLTADADAAVGQVFNLTGGHPCPTREFFGYYTQMLGIREPRVAPTAVAVGIAATVGTALRAVGRPSEANAATMRMLSVTGDVSIEKARRLLGWEPCVDLDEGMRRTEAWLRAEGYL